MDVFLFFMMLVGFVVLYLTLGVFLFWTVMIMLILALVYIGLKYPRGRADWHFSIYHTLYMILMIIMIMLIFIIIGPQPVPLAGSQLRFCEQVHTHSGSNCDYTTWFPPDWGWSVRMDGVLILWTLLVFGLFFLIVFALLMPAIPIPKLGIGMAGISTKGGEEEGKPKIGMGA